MIRAAILALLPVAASAGERLEYTPDTDPNNGIYGRITVVNIWDRQGRYGDTVTFQTTLGPVTVTYESTYNIACVSDPVRCADDFEVMDMPDGIVAVPQFGSVLEDETIEILLMEYAGL